MTQFALVLSAIRGRPLRSLLTVLGVGVALGTFLCFQSLAWGLEKNWMGLYRDRGTDLIVTQDTFFAGAIAQSVGDDIRRLPGVRSVTPLMWGLSTVDGQPSIPLTGWDPDASTLAHLTVRGRRPAPNATEAILGAYVARRLGKDIGGSVEIGGTRVAVVGVFTGENVLELESVYIPLGLFQQLRGAPGVVGGFYVDVVRGNDTAATEASIAQVTRAIDARFPRLVTYRTDDFARNNDIVGLTRATAWGTSVIAFCVAVLGVLNTMSMAVLERTREIGLLRAVGWRRRRVLGLLLSESVLLTTAGGGLGIALAAVGLRVLAQVPRMRVLAITGSPPELYVETLLIGLVLGLLGGLLPAHRAAQISPADALRHE